MAQTFECPSCALQVERGAEACPYCGYEFPPEPRGMKAAAVLMVLLLAYPLFRLLSWLFG